MCQELACTFSPRTLSCEKMFSLKIIMFLYNQDIWPVKVTLKRELAILILIKYWSVCHKLKIIY